MPAVTILHHEDHVQTAINLVNISKLFPLKCEILVCIMLNANYSTKLTTKSSRYFQSAESV